MNPEVVTIGLGYIGLPTSALIANCGTRVLGVDINPEIVKIINNGKIHIVEPDLENIVFDTVSSGMFKASVKPAQADVYIIVVPTPFKDKYEPDISFVESATKDIIPLLKKGDLYIIESTSPVGTTEKMQDLIFRERPELENNLFIAYCPERVLPGNVMYELIENDRVIGGVNEVSTKKAIRFYQKYVKGNLHPTDARTAEMCKLVENSSRDVQIAFANELSLICDKAKINVTELIDLANKHPRVNILKPGCGVGGHCIAVDPYFISSKFPEQSKIIKLAREINNYKPEWCIGKIKKAIFDFNRNSLRHPKVGILGLSFKPDIDDLRESPALLIAKKINQSNLNCELYFFEPNIDSHDDLKISNLKEKFDEIDIVVALVKHKHFCDLDIKNKKLLNFCGL